MMTINKQGEGKVYENNKYVSVCQFGLRRSYNHLYFRFTESAIDEKDKPFFQFNEMSNGTGYLRVCEEALIIGESMGDGRQWVFKRVSSNKVKSQ